MTPLDDAGEPPGSKSADAVPDSSCFTCAAFVRSEWEALDKTDVTTLDQAKVTRIYSPGEVLFREGEAVRGVHCIGAGLVCLRRTNWAGRSIPLSLQYPGDTLGGAQVLSGSVHGATAEVVEKARICFVAGDVVRTFLSRGIYLALSLAQRLASRLEQAENRLLQRKSISARGRVAQLLVDLSGAHGVHGRGGGFILKLPLSLADLGLAIGINPTIMSRMVQALQRDGVVAMRGRTLVVPDRDRLMAEIH